MAKIRMDRTHFEDECGGHNKRMLRMVDRMKMDQPKCIWDISVTVETEVQTRENRRL